MALKIDNPSRFFGNNTTLKFIQEFYGKVSTTQEDISIAIMTAMKGWEESGQIAQFNEYIYVITGRLFVSTKTYSYIIKAGEAIKISKDEWVKFSTPTDTAHYIAICSPAFQEHLVKRDEK